MPLKERVHGRQHFVIRLPFEEKARRCRRQRLKALQSNRVIQERVLPVVLAFLGAELVRGRVGGVRGQLSHTIARGLP